MVDMVRGAAPLDQLARAIRRVAVDQPDDLRAMLMSGPDGLRRAVDLVIPVEGAEMLLIVDQFEELFTLVNSDRARNRFVNALVTAATIRSREATRQRSVAETQARRATTQGLASTALAELGVDPELSLLLAIEAVDISQRAGDEPLPDAIDALHRGLATSRLSRRVGEGVVADCSDDGEPIVMGTADGSLEVRRSEDLAKVADIAVAHEGPVTVIDFSSGGSRLVTGGADGAVRIWDVRSGLLLASTKSVDAEVSSVEFSPAGDRILSGATDGSIRISDTLTGSEITSRVVGGSAGDEVTQAAWLSDDKIVYLGASGNATPVTADATTLQPLEALETLVSGCGGFAVSGSAGLVALGTETPTVVLIAIGGETGRTELVGHASQVCAADCSADESRLATGSLDATIHIWSTEDGRSEMVLVGHGSTITSVAFSANGYRLLSTSSAGEVFEWTAGNDAATERATVRSDFSPDVRFGLADSSIMVIVGSGGIKTLDSVTGELISEVSTGVGGQFFQHPVAVTPDGEHLLVPSLRRGQVDVWALDPLENERTLVALAVELEIVRVDRAGESIAALAVDESVHLWSLEDGRLDWSTAESSSAFARADMTFTANGQRLALTRNEDIEVLDVNTGERLDLWPRPQQTTVVAGLPGRLFSGGLSGDIAEWDVATGSIVQVLRPRSPPEVLAFDKSTERLVVGELEGCRRVEAVHGLGLVGAKDHNVAHDDGRARELWLGLESPHQLACGPVNGEEGPQVGSEHHQLIINAVNSSTVAMVSRVRPTTINRLTDRLAVTGARQSGPVSGQFDSSSAAPPLQAVIAKPASKTQSANLPMT